MPSRIADALRWYATYTPNKIALIWSDGAESYSQLWSRVRRVSDSLTRLGIKSGDRIAILMQNSPRYVELYQAAALLGIAVVPLNFRFVASEVEYVINHSARGRWSFDSQYTELITGLRSKLTAISDLYIVSDGGQTSEAYSYEQMVETRCRGRAIGASDLDECYFPGVHVRHDRIPKRLRQSASRLCRLSSSYGDDLQHRCRRDRVHGGAPLS